MLFSNKDNALAKNLGLYQFKNTVHGGQ